MASSTINQKDYLRKYLSIGKEHGAKKKKRKKQTESVKIIDDDLDTNFINLVEDNPFEANEDAPQIVAVIDDRPPSMRVDEQTKDHMWKPIGSAEEGASSEKPMVNRFTINKQAIKTLLNISSRQSSAKSKMSTQKRTSEVDLKQRGKETAISSPSRKHSQTSSSDISRKYQGESSNSATSDLSPPRSKRRNSPLEADASPPRRRKKVDDLSPRRRMEDSNDSSPPRRRRDGDDSSPPRRRRDSDDSSPPRKSRNSGNMSLTGKRGGSDISPVRRRMSSDSSPPRKRKDSDSSPPRKKRKDNDDVSPPRKRKNSDSSPPRKPRHSDDISPPRRRRDNDISPPRKKRLTEDISPPRKKKSSKDISPLRRRQNSDDSSPPRKKRDEGQSEKMKRTLDGKVAGLQKASELVKELKQFKKREDELFSQLSAEQSGANARAVMRDKRTGKIRDLHQESLEKQRKDEEEKKRKEKYDRWGRGLKQIEDSERKTSDMLHEMNKPLARYAEDEDLERFLKEKEHEGDPMLQEIRAKKRKKAIEEGTYSEKPQFMGEFMPNRYGIRPGHRWDGVDRSNGYEKKYFEVQNERTAQREETYKWSTEDM